MKSSSNRPAWKNWLAAILIAAGLLSLVRLTVRSIAYQKSRQGFSSEQIHEAFRKSEEQDRANWEKMWEENGKKAPSAPATPPAEPEAATQNP